MSVRTTETTFVVPISGRMNSRTHRSYSLAVLSLQWNGTYSDKNRSHKLRTVIELRSESFASLGLLPIANWEMISLALILASSVVIAPCGPMVNRFKTP